MRRNSDNDSEDSMSLVGYTGRTASGMVKEMLNTRSSRCISSADSDADSAVYSLSEDAPGRDSVFDSFILNGASVLSMKHKGKRPTMPTFTATGGRVPSEMYQIQDQLVFLNEHVLAVSDGEADSDDESAHSLPPSFLDSPRDSLTSGSTSSGTSNSTGGESRSSTPTSPLKKDEKLSKSATMKPSSEQLAPGKKGLERGYATLRPNRNKSKTKPPSVSGNRFPFFRKKKNSAPSEMNISPPSPTSPSPQESPSKLTRNRQSRSAFRKERGSRRITNKEQPTIPESSYSFQIKTVNVVFRGSSKMEVPCRGEWIVYSV